MIPVDEWAQAAGELLEVHQEARGGEAQIVTIGKTRYRGIVSEIDPDRVPVDGGWDFSGGFTVQIPLAQFKRGLPGKNSVIRYGGHELRIFSDPSIINAMVEIIAANTSP